MKTKDIRWRREQRQIGGRRVHEAVNFRIEAITPLYMGLKGRYDGTWRKKEGCKYSFPECRLLSVKLNLSEVKPVGISGRSLSRVFFK